MTFEIKHDLKTLIMAVLKQLPFQSERGGCYKFVLVSLIAALVAYPLCVSFFIGRLLLNLWLVVTLTQLIVSLNINRASRTLSICLGSAPLLLAILGFSADLFNFQVLFFFKLLLPFSALFFFFCSWWIICSIFREKQVTLDLLYGSVVAYLLIGISWAVIFCCIELFAPDSFSFGMETALPERAGALLYFSFVTLTTLGYGDVLPTTGFARTTAYLESVTGVMYPAILVATLVNSFRTSNIEH